MSNDFVSWISFLLKLKMSREFNVIIERDADGYFVAFPLSKDVIPKLNMKDELMERIREAIA